MLSFPFSYVKVDVPTKTVTVTFDPAKTNEQTLTKAFEKIKIKVTKTNKK